MRYIMGMKTNPDNELGNVIRAAFHRSKLSIRRVSVESGVPYASAHGFLSGRCDVALGTAARICSVLGLRLTADKRKRK